MPSAIVNHRRSLLPASGPAPIEWWDAELGAYQDLTKLVPAVLNNDPVAVLTGQVTTDIKNTAGSTRPLLKTAAVNGHSCVQFNGSNNYLNGLFTFSRPSSLFMVIRIDTWTDIATIVYGGTNAGTYYMYMDPVTPDITTQFGGGASGGNYGQVVGTFAILALILNGDGTGLIRINDLSNSSPGNGPAVASGITWAAATNTFSYFQCGAVSIARMQLYNVALTAGQETVVRNALNTKYNCF